ncbi:MAG: Lrp/AsnC family transcriptional regulator [Chloroflexota bacterium]
MTVRAVDYLDRRIVALVQQDGRTPSQEIARQLGVAEGTVRKRLERLITDGFVRVTAVADPAKFGYAVQTIIGVQTESSSAPAVAGQIAVMPEALAVYLTSGTYDVIVEAALPSYEALLSFLSDHIGSIPGVRRSEAYHILKVLKRAREWSLPSLPVEGGMPSLLTEKA